MPDNALPVRVTLNSFYPLIPAAAALLGGLTAAALLADAPTALRWLGVAATVVVAVALTDWLRRFLRR